MTADVRAEHISYEKQKELARHDDPAVRMALAARADVKPEIMYFLAEDDATEVRRIVAENTAAPRQTFALLARDHDGDVRGNLAQKVAQLAPGLSADEQDKISHDTLEALETLARDQMTRVRAILSDALKDVADASSDIIKTLALDSELEVSGPVLEFSPVLSDADLVEIIQSGPATGGLNAISRRGDVSETVADAIIDTDDIHAIGDLLGNDSAQIREEALDDLIGRASEIDLWQAPLVARPKLPKGAAARLTNVVADNVLQTLTQRADLDPETLAAVKNQVRTRISAAEPDPESFNDAAVDFLRVDPPLEMVRRQYKSGKLSVDMINRALQAGDYAFVFAALLVLADVDTDVGHRMFQEKSPKGIMALCWQANMPASMALHVQQRMGRTSPYEVIKPADDGTYPLPEDQMAWQIEFFRNLVNKGAEDDV